MSITEDPMQKAMRIIHDYIHSLILDYVDVKLECAIENKC